MPCFCHHPGALIPNHFIPGIPTDPLRPKLVLVLEQQLEDAKATLVKMHLEGSLIIACRASVFSPGWLCSPLGVSRISATCAVSSLLLQQLFGLVSVEKPSMMASKHS